MPDQHQHTRRRVLAIGIDGGTWTVLRPAIAGGLMPWLARNVQQGASGILESTIPAITPAAWSAFQTGRNPGATGVFEFSAWDRTTHRSRLVNSTCLNRTIADLLSEAGLRVGLINLPLTYPPRPINGCLIAGMLTPSMDVTFTHPPEFQAELLHDVPDYQIFRFDCLRGVAGQDRPSRFLAPLTRTLQDRLRAAQVMLRHGPFDFFMVHFQAPDILQHLVWPCLDPDDPQYHTPQAQRLRKTFFTTLDNAMATLACEFAGDRPDDTLTIVLSDHGFEPHQRMFNLGNWLVHKHYLRPSAAHHLARSFFDLGRRAGMDRLLGALRHRDSWDKQQRKVLDFLPAFHWSHSRAFAMGGGGEGMIYLTEPDPQRRATADRIIRQLTAIRDPLTGRPLVQAVHRREDIYHGPELDTLPDLVVTPHSGSSLYGRYLPHAPLWRSVTPRTDPNIGKHHREGIAVFAGRDVQPQTNLHAHILDMLPTILSWLRLPLPEDLDGKPLRQVFTPNVDFTPAAAAPSAAPEPTAAPDEVFSSEQQREIENRLRDLGYL